MTKLNTLFYSLVLLLATAVAVGTATISYVALDVGEGPESADFALEAQQWLTYFVPLSFVALFLCQHVAYRVNRASGWLYLVSWLYFCAFTIVDYVWLTDEIFHFRKSMGTWEGGFVIAPLFGAVFAFFAALVSVFAFVRAKRSRSNAAATAPAAG